ncbi:hypothetical protein Tco_1464204, partial [Tanacetum coccineum]
MALMAFSDSEKQHDDLLVKLSDTDFKATTYKRGLATLEGQIVKYREHEVLFSKEIALLKRSIGSVGSKEYQMGLLRVELEKVKQEKEGFEFKIAKFDKSAKDLSEMLESQITDKSKKGVSDDEDEVESIPKVEKKTAIPTAAKKESVKPEKPVRRSVSCPKNMVPRAVLMKSGLKTVNNARPVNTVRSVNTGRPFSTDRSFNTVRPSYTAHPKSTIHCARPRTNFQNQAQSTIHRPFYKKTALTNRCFNQRFNTGRPFSSSVNTVRARGFNVVKPSACWVWRPIKPNGASLSNLQLNDKGFVDSGCSRHMAGNIAHLSDFKDFDGGYVTFRGGAFGGRISGKQGVSKSSTSFQQDQDCILMPIWKDASYFGDAAPRSVADAQIQDEDGLHAENDATEESHDDSSFKDNGTADQQVNTARPEVNTGSREVSTANPEINTATPEDFVRPSTASEITSVDDQEVKLGNIPQS